MTAAPLGTLPPGARPAAPGGAPPAVFARQVLAARALDAWAESWLQRPPTNEGDREAAAVLWRRVEGQPGARTRLGIAYAYAAWRRKRPWCWLP